MVQIISRRVHIADTAAQLDLQLRLFCHADKHLAVFRHCTFGAIQIHHMQIPSACLFKTQGCFHRILRYLFAGSKIALCQTDALSILNINCR